MCGEHCEIEDLSTPRAGSSPHVRGAPQEGPQTSSTNGIIPACAGSTVLANVDAFRDRDHPRMCGEHATPVLDGLRGLGSSPHVRGALLPAGRRCGFSGIIPACAGSTKQLRLGRVQLRDHPRMCGEHKGLDERTATYEGSSPHVRGAPGRCPDNANAHGIIPACAGSTRARCLWTTSTRDHPRMCGEHPMWTYDHFPK